MHAADGHEPLHSSVLQSPLRERLVEGGKIRRAAVEVRQMPLNRELLVRRDRLSLQPYPAYRAEQLTWEWQNEVGVQHAVNAVLHPRHLLNDLHSLRHEAPERLRRRDCHVNRHWPRVTERCVAAPTS